MTFGARLRAARQALNLTQEDLGLYLGVSGATVSRWESGRDSPTFSLLPELSRRLLVSLDTLISGRAFGEPDPSSVGEARASYATDAMRVNDAGEMALLLAYRALDEARRKAIQTLIKPLKEM